MSHARSQQCWSLRARLVCVLVAALFLPGCRSQLFLFPVSKWSSPPDQQGVAFPPPSDGGDTSSQESPDGGPGDSPPGFYTPPDTEQPPAVEPSPLPRLLPPRPQRPPAPPPAPPAPPAPPPPAPVPLRLAGAPKNTSAAGVLQLYAATTRSWAALCVRADALAVSAWRLDAPVNQVAKLACRQLGLPLRAARLVPPEDQEGFAGMTPEVLLAMDAKALIPDAVTACPNARDAGSLAACSGVGVSARLYGSCTAMAAGLAAQRAGLPFVPAAVRCTDDPPAAPPPPSPPPPRPPALRLPVRLVDPGSGLSLEPQPHQAAGGGPGGEAAGRLEVLYQGVWGSVCRLAALDVALAQYACRYLGLPAAAAAIYSDRRTSALRNATEARKQPIWFVAARGCEVQELEPEPPPGQQQAAGAPVALSCYTLYGPQTTPEVFKEGSGLMDEDTGAALQRLAAACDPGRRGHLHDAHVACRGAPPPPPPPSKVPAPAPAPATVPAPPYFGQTPPPPYYGGGYGGYVGQPPPPPYYGTPPPPYGYGYGYGNAHGYGFGAY